MAVYVKRSCPNCGEVIEGYTRDYRAIGRPFIRCENCKTIIKLSHITEWGLQGPVDKFLMFLLHCWTSLLWGMSIPLATLFYDKYSDAYKMNDGLFIKLVFVGFVVMFIGRGFFLMKAINESQARMRDQNYREFLCKLGFVNGSENKGMKGFFKDRTNTFDFLVIMSVVIAVLLYIIN